MTLIQKLFTLFLLFILVSGSFAGPSAEKYKIGDVVSDFTIENFDGNSYSLSKSNAKATVIVFISTECPFVQPYTERLINLTNEFTPKGIVIWGINSNSTEPTDEVINHANEKKYNFPVLKDNNNVVADIFSAERTPEVFVIDNASMKLIYHGRIDDNKDASEVTSNDLQNALNEFLNGTEITNKENKAFGCSIKR
ncbi:MAG: Thiol-disulfide oxidoreductase ResA [Ignavibacteria bacterium]|nr:Thiol-disulfide oxidoreductase ResA [Ignavibacteria bacterium]